MTSDFAIADLASANQAARGASTIWTLTPRLRWLVRDNSAVLQQMWQGARGGQRWEDVPRILAETLPRADLVP